jgi:hypothetical protein
MAMNRKISASSRNWTLVIYPIASYFINRGNLAHYHVGVLIIPQSNYLCGAFLLEKLIVTQLVKKFPTFYATQRFITVFTRAYHWSLSWARWIQSTPSHQISLRSILIHSNITLPSMPRSSDQNSMHFSPLLCVLHVPFMPSCLT